MPRTQTAPARGGPDSVTLREATRVWTRIGLTSFGGPTAQIALMHRVLVQERGWLTEDQFLRALGFCMLLPGPEAMQLATYAGWRLHGTLGGLIAGGLFVLPGAIVVLALSIGYAAYGHIAWVTAAFLGIKSVVLVLVLQALFRLSRRALQGAWHGVIALLSFVAIFAFGLPFPWVVLAAGAVGLLRPPASPATSVQPPGVPWTRTLRTALVGAAVCAAPLVTLVAVVGREHLLSRLAWFFTKLALVTFGGAYAVLTYMNQDVVTRYHWLTAGQMIDGLGLAETTPGPLILVTQFVGYLAAYRAHPEAALAMGLLGAAVALWATFAPCFLWIFLGAPYLDQLGSQPRLQGALSAITAAVLGVILNLALWFAMHVGFAHVGAWSAGPVHLAAPEWRTLDWRVLLLATASGVALLRLRWSVHRTLAVAALVAVLIARVLRAA